MTKDSNTHLISFLVANKPGVLVRISQVFARRGFNIDSLVVSPSVDEKFSRMTIAAKGDRDTLDQIIKQSAKLIDVIHSAEHTNLDAVHYEFGLLKIKNTPANKKLIESGKRKFGVRIVETNRSIVIAEQTGTTDQLNAFESLFKKPDIIEMIRSGKLVMAKTKEPT